MAGASDKVRFYMEQAVPQLREFEEKKIFTKVRTPAAVYSAAQFTPNPPTPLLKASLFLKFN